MVQHTTIYIGGHDGSSVTLTTAVVPLFVFGSVLGLVPVSVSVSVSVSVKVRLILLRLGLDYKLKSYASI